MRIKLKCLLIMIGMMFAASFAFATDSTAVKPEYPPKVTPGTILMWDAGYITDPTVNRNFFTNPSRGLCAQGFQPYFVLVPNFMAGLAKVNGTGGASPWVVKGYSLWVTGYQIVSNQYLVKVTECVASDSGGYISANSTSYIAFQWILYCYPPGSTVPPQPPGISC